MTESFDPKSMPGAAALWDGFATASKSLQTFASDMQNASKDSFDAGSQLMDKLRQAKTIEEAVSLQTAFMQQSFNTYAEYTRKFSDLMMALPMEMAKHSQAAFQQGAEAMTKAAHDVGNQVKKAGDDFNSSHG